MTKEETIKKLELLLASFELMLKILPSNQEILSENRSECAETIYDLLFIPNQGSMKKTAKKAVKKTVTKKKK